MGKVKRLIITAIILIFISSYVLVLAPLTSFDDGGFPQVLAYCTGALFWLGLIVGYVIFVMASKSRKRQSGRKKSEAAGEYRPGVFVFFSSRAALIVDILCILSVLLFVVCLFNSYIFPEGIVYFIISTTIFLVQVHSIINGVNFRCAFNLGKNSGKKRGGDK